MTTSARAILILNVCFGLAVACAAADHDVNSARSPGGAAGTSGAAGGCGGPVESRDAGDASAGRGSDYGGPGDAMLEVPVVEEAAVGDAACATATAQTEPVVLPVDIIWVVDNSVSMKPAIQELTQGLNAFAELISQKGLDYRVIVLSLRSSQPEVSVLGSPRYAVCVPPPLAGDTLCGNGARFFHASVDIRSLQTLEQILGTLGQTAGYRQGDERGGESWRAWLRPRATHTFVIVSDDNSRFSADQFEHFLGGQNPFNSNDLPPGLLEPFWAGSFDGYVFSGIYGWGSDTDRAVRCQYPGGTLAPSSGATYTELVERTGGVRARICDGAAAWTPFFDAVAQAVVEQAPGCELPLPVPSADSLDPRLVNVITHGQSGTTLLHKVSRATECDERGWYYDDEAAPTLVVLCPQSCERVQSEVRGDGGSIEVMFGCTSVVR